MPAAGGAGGTVDAGAEAPGWASEAQEGGSSSDSDGHEAGWLDDADGDDVTSEGYQPRRTVSHGRKRQRAGSGSAKPRAARRGRRRREAWARAAQRWAGSAGRSTDAGASRCTQAPGACATDGGD